MKKKLNIKKLIYHDSILLNCFLGFTLITFYILILYIISIFDNSSFGDDVYFFNSLLIATFSVLIFRLMYFQSIYRNGIAIKGDISRFSIGFIKYSFNYNNKKFEFSYHTSFRKYDQYIRKIEDIDDVTIIFKPNNPKRNYIQNLFV